MEQEKVGDLLDGDFLGDAKNNGGGNEGVGADGIGGSGGADLLGFDSTPTPLVADGFGGALAPTAAHRAMESSEGAADLLGLDGVVPPMGLGGVVPPRTEPATHAIPGYMGGVTNSENTSPDAMGRGRLAPRPSLVTGANRAGDNASIDVNHHLAGIGGGAAITAPRVSPNFSGMESNSSTMIGGAIGGSPHECAAEERSETAQAETSRKMQMAAGLFAGVVSSDNAPKQETTKKKPVMAIGNNSTAMSALDDLLPMGETAVAPALPAPGYGSVFNSNNDIDSAATRLTDAFAQGPVGTSHANNMGTIAPSAPAPSMAPPAPPLSDPFGASVMGGNTSMPPAPTMAPPPPPTMEPPEPPPSLPPTAPSPPALPAPTMAAQNDSALGGNPSVEQMQEIIKQQQAQMNQMMQMMQQMQGNGGAGTNHSATQGWPPTS